MRWRRTKNCIQITGGELTKKNDAQNHHHRHTRIALRKRTGTSRATNKRVVVHAALPEKVETPICSNVDFVLIFYSSNGASSASTSRVDSSLGQ